MEMTSNHCHMPKFAVWSLALDPVRQIFRPFWPLSPRNPHFPALRSGHRLFQRPSLGKQFLSSVGRNGIFLVKRFRGDCSSTQSFRTVGTLKPLFAIQFFEADRFDFHCGRLMPKENEAKKPCVSRWGYPLNHSFSITPLVRSAYTWATEDRPHGSRRLDIKSVQFSFMIISLTAILP